MQLAGEDSLLRDYPPARAEYANTGEDDNLADLGLDSDAEADHQPQDQADEQQNGAEADVPEALEGEAMDEDAQADQEIEEDENASIQADEAEEELPAVSKKRSEAQELQAMREEVRALIARMEQAVEKDIDNLLEGKPATRKLQMLPEVLTFNFNASSLIFRSSCPWHRGLSMFFWCCNAAVVSRSVTLPRARNQPLAQPTFDTLRLMSFLAMQIDDAMAKVKMHDMLLQYGFVGLLKAFLEPMKTQKVGRDGDRVPTLPHAQVRAAVYRALQKLPINTLDISCRHMLKSAQIGPVLRFYAEVRDEDPINRKMVNDLLNRWMAPIVEEGRKAVANAEHDELRKQVRTNLLCVASHRAF